MKLFLDATDFPPDDGQSWTIVRTMDEAVERVLAKRLSRFRQLQKRPRRR